MPLKAFGVSVVLTLALIVAAIGVALDAQTPVGAGSRYTWDQGAASLAEAQSYVYKLYKDGASGVVVTGVTCTAPVPPSPLGTFPCSAPFAAEVPGVPHSVTLTATGAGTLESPPSVAYAYVYSVQTARPLNLRKQ